MTDIVEDLKDEIAELNAVVDQLRAELKAADKMNKLLNHKLQWKKNAGSQLRDMKESMK